jgi:branched-chain amino acid transport system substrate-binding protein
MKKANSPDPAKYLPELAKIEFTGATGRIAFDQKGDRKDAEITIFTMKGGKLDPIAIIKAGKTISYDEFVKTGAAPADSTKDAAKK